jgi:hypothetical protein
MSLSVTPSYIEVERVTRVAALGVRFYDWITQQIVSDLYVAASWMATSGTWSARRPCVMSSGPSGVFVLHSGPREWADLETHADDDSFWDRLPSAQDVMITVIDPAGRYLPFTFTVRVPQPSARPGGLLVPECLLDSPNAMPWPLDAIPLFPAPAAPVPEGVASVRADLWDLAAGRPAAGAVLEFMYGGLVIGRGIADDRGVALVVTSYPAPIDFTPDSPGTGESAWLQHWSLDVSVAWRSGSSLWQTQDGTSTRTYLNLCGALDQLKLPRATAWASRSPDQPLASATLRMNEDLILSSVVGGAPASQLFITPAP